MVQQRTSAFKSTAFVHGIHRLSMAIHLVAERLERQGANERKSMSDLIPLKKQQKSDIYFMLN